MRIGKKPIRMQIRSARDVGSWHELANQVSRLTGYFMPRPHHVSKSKDFRTNSGRIDIFLVYVQDESKVCVYMSAQSAD